MWTVLSGVPEDRIVAVKMACADCGCIVDGGVRVATCSDPNCCCRDVPMPESQSEATEAKPSA
jgi:hypothetical protein